MTTSTFDGAQPALSAYRTVNVIVVDVVPDPGVAFPALRTGAACDAPLQLAAAARPEFAGMSTIAMAATRANATAPAARNRGA